MDEGKEGLAMVLEGPPPGLLGTCAVREGRAQEDSYSGYRQALGATH